MNGSLSTLQDEIKKTANKKTLEKFKIIVMIFSTNILVFILCSNPFSKNEEKKNIENFQIRNGYQLLELPVQSLLLNIDNHNVDKPVTLYSLDKKVLAEIAYLRKGKKNINNLEHFNFEIKSEDVVHFAEMSQEGVIVVPYVEKKILAFKKIIKTKRGSTYEVDF
jgi:hypothetical protein